MQGKAKRSARVPSLPAGRTTTPSPRRDGEEALQPLAPAPEAAEPSPQSHERPASAAENRGFPGVSGLAGCRPEAFALSQAALMEGLEELSVEMSGIARSGVESAAARAREMLSVKTLGEAVELQLAVARDGFEAFFAGFFKLSELGVEVARKAAQPLVAELLARAGGASR